MEHSLSAYRGLGSTFEERPAGCYHNTSFEKSSSMFKGIAVLVSRGMLLVLSLTPYVQNHSFIAMLIRHENDARLHGELKRRGRTIGTVV